MRITGETKILGIIGYPIEHSFSPIMHNAALKEAGLNYCYLPFQVKPEYLKDAVKALRVLNIIGVNVTIPHKERVMEFLDEIEESAKLVGAVNTIYQKEGKLIGTNTDAPGFLNSLQNFGFNPEGKRVVILGAGGAAKAVAFSLARAGVYYMCIINRTISKAQDLTKKIAPHIIKGIVKATLYNEENIKEEMKTADIIINATSCGMWPKIEETPVQSFPDLKEGTLVYDLIYNPLKTKFLKKAEEKGAKVISGEDMLLQQGAISFQIWTGKPAPQDVMRQALNSFFGKM